VTRRIFNIHLVDTQSMLEQLEEEEAAVLPLRPAKRATSTDVR
jgi:hypothetical protein